MTTIMSRLGSPLSNAANAQMTSGKTIRAQRILWEQTVTMELAETEKWEPHESTSYFSISSLTLWSFNFS